MRIITLSLYFALSILYLSCNGKKSPISTDEFFQHLSVVTIKTELALLNISSAQTTRTAEGGAYVPKEAVNCKSGICEIIDLRCSGIDCSKSKDGVYSPILRYEPKHPDSDLNGYVAYPAVDVKAEMDKMVKLQRARDFLFEAAPVEKSFFLTKEAEAYFLKYPALNKSYNYKNLIYK
jgi:flagellar basal-body rod protein FlgC